MDRNKIFFIIALVLIASAGIVYYQYKIHRTPVELPESQESTMEDREIRTTDGTKHAVPLDEILSGGPPKDGIPSIDDPVFESPARADRYLKDDGFGLSVEVDGEYRYYPYQILVWHEIVNETFNGRSLLITYCPLCFTGIVFDRSVDGESVEFGTSGKLWNSNLVMYDRKTDSYWSQVLGEAIVGPKTGTQLGSYPAETIKWAEWLEEHPDGEVLSRDTGIDRDYTRDPYGDYYDNQNVMFPLSYTDDRLATKTKIFGVRFNDDKKAYPWDSIERERLIQDSVGDTPIMVVFDEVSGSVKGYKRTVQDRTLRFEMGDGELVDSQTETVWNLNGEAMSGGLTGESLDSIVLDSGYWFCWAAAFPQTKLYNP